MLLENIKDIQSKLVSLEHEMKYLMGSRKIWERAKNKKTLEDIQEAIENCDFQEIKNIDEAKRLDIRNTLESLMLKSKVQLVVDEYEKIIKAIDKNS